MLQQSSWTPTPSLPASALSSRSNAQQQFLILLRSCCCCCRLLHKHQLSLRMDVVSVSVCVCLVMQSARWSAALRLHWQKAVENNYSKVSAIFMPDVNEEETLHGGKGTWRLCSLWQRLLMAFPQNTNTERDGDYAERERERERAVYSLMHC